MVHQQDVHLKNQLRKAPASILIQLFLYHHPDFSFYEQLKIKNNARAVTLKPCSKYSPRRALIAAGHQPQRNAALSPYARESRYCILGIPILDEDGLSGDECVFRRTKIIGWV